MYYFVDTGCSVAEIAFLSLLAGSFFPKKNIHTWLKILLVLIFAFIVIALSVSPSAVFARTAFWLAGGAAFIAIGYQTKVLPAIFVSFFYVTICGLTEVAVLVILSLFHFDNQELLTIGNGRILCIILSHVIELSIIIIIRGLKGSKNGRFLKILFPVCPCLIVNVLFCCFLADYISRGNNMNAFHLVVAIGLLYTSIVIVFYTTWLQEQQEARHSLELANHHYAMQKEYYEQLHSQQEQTRALWHDMKKYVRAIEADTAPEASIAQLQDMVDSISDVVDVNNRVVSIILNEYVQAAKDAETTLSLDVQVPDELPLVAADLYILLGNTLDNALNACAELPKEERRITLRLRLHNQLLFYRISNPFLEEHLKRKRNQFHGYGLKNVQECVKRNRGDMEVSTENGEFVVSIFLNV